MSISVDTNTLSKKKKIKGEVWIRYPKNELYLISNYGRVMNTKTNNILSPTLGKSTVKQSLSGNKTGCAFQYIPSMAALVYSLFKKDPTPGFISFIDNNPYNISPDNMVIHKKYISNDKTSNANGTLILPSTYNKASVFVNGKEYYEEELNNMPLNELENLVTFKEKEEKERLIRLLLA